MSHENMYVAEKELCKGTLIELEADAEDGGESDLSAHEREYYIYSARRRVV